eukprot:scaffold114152_cov19-Tisochrysis_lutea.AAC.1
MSSQRRRWKNLGFGSKLMLRSQGAGPTLQVAGPTMALEKHEGNRSKFHLEHCLCSLDRVDMIALQEAASAAQSLPYSGKKAVVVGAACPGHVVSQLGGSWAMTSGACCREEEASMKGVLECQSLSIFLMFSPVTNMAPGRTGSAQWHDLMEACPPGSALRTDVKAPRTQLQPGPTESDWSGLWSAALILVVSCGQLRLGLLAMLEEHVL